MLIEMRHLLVSTLFLLSICAVRSESSESDRHDKDADEKDADPSAPSTMPSPSPSYDPCSVNSEGLFGYDGEGESLVVSYQYLLVFDPLYFIFDSLQDVQYSVIGAIGPSFFPDCTDIDDEERRTRHLSEVDTIIGLEASPSDSVAAECESKTPGSECNIIDGKVTVHLESAARHLGLNWNDVQPEGDVESLVKAAIKSEMSNNLADSLAGITRMEYIDEIEGDGSDIAFERTEEIVEVEKQGFKGAPFIAGCSAILGVGVLFTVLRRKRIADKEDEKDMENVSFGEEDNDSDVSYEEIGADELYHVEYQVEGEPEKTSLAQLQIEKDDEIEMHVYP